jgi:hypothetical protein
MTVIVRVELPAHLRGLASTSHEVHISLEGSVTQCAVLALLNLPILSLRGQFGTTRVSFPSFTSSRVNKIFPTCHQTIHYHLR